MITERGAFSARIKESIEQRGVKLDDMAITKIAFSPEFTAKVEAKQRAQRASK